MRILLCARHRLLTDLLTAALQRAGHDVVATATAPDDAVDAAIAHAPDLCLLDPVFGDDAGEPALDPGVDAVARIRAATRAAVLVLSARCDEPVVRAALAAGAGGFAGEDEGIDELVRAVERVGAGEAPPVTPLRRRGPRPVPGPSGPAGPWALTGREREALRLVADGRSTKEIARSMRVAHSTARTHVQNVLGKLGVRSRLQVAALVTRAGGPDRLDDLRPASGDGYGAPGRRTRAPRWGGDPAR